MFLLRHINLVIAQLYPTTWSAWPCVHFPDLFLKTPCLSPFPTSSVYSILILSTPLLTDRAVWFKKGNVSFFHTLEQEKHMELYGPFAFPFPQFSCFHCGLYFLYWFFNAFMEHYSDLGRGRWRSQILFLKYPCHVFPPGSPYSV